MKLLLVGNSGGTNVAWSMRRALPGLGIAAEFCNALEAYRSPRWLALVSWWLLARRPSNLRRFSQSVLETCRRLKPDCLLSTGLSPMTANTLHEIGRMGIARVNYLTDDPWNPGFRSNWFLKSLGAYDSVFSPRRSNLDELRAHGCKHVEYLPFGYDPELFIQTSWGDGGTDLQSDVMFAGGAEADRATYVASLIRAGFRVAVYGDYWYKYREIRTSYHGHADPKVLRSATAAAKVSLCLVRRANRDGHVMRSFEIPAIGGCMLTEHTAEHEAIFGEEGKAVVYFRTKEEMVEKARWLLDHEEERRRLAAAAHELITRGKHTYADRLQTMLACVNGKK